MSKTNWTPGKWSATKGETYKVRDKDGVSIAYLTWLNRGGRRPGSEVSANLALIAASPELYDALAEAVAIAIERQHHDEFDADNWQPRIDRWNAALARARGEE